LEKLLAFYPSVHDPGSIEVLLKKIAEGKAPKVVNADWIEASGFKRQQDENLHGLLLFLGFIDDNSAPTNLWAAYGGDKNMPRLLGNLIKSGYHRIFKDIRIEERDGQALMAFFKKETGASDAISAYMVLTFRVLCDLAVIEEIPPAEPERPAPKPAAARSNLESVPAFVDGPVPVKLTLEIDIRTDPELRFLLKKLLQKQLGE
jgi:hypothetical protein